MVTVALRNFSLDTLADDLQLGISGGPRDSGATGAPRSLWLLGRPEGSFPGCLTASVTCSTSLAIDRLSCSAHGSTPMFSSLSGPPIEIGSSSSVGDEEPLSSGGPLSRELMDVSEDGSSSSSGEDEPDRAS